MADSITKTLTVTNDVYTIGDVVGGLITFDVIGGAMQLVNSVKLAGVSAIAYDLWLLSADLATPADDNDAFTLVVADEPKILGVIPILGGDYKKGPAAFNIATVKQAGLMVKSTGSKVYAYLVATATTTPGTTTIYLTVDFVDLF